MSRPRKPRISVFGYSHYHADRMLVAELTLHGKFRQVPGKRPDVAVPAARGRRFP
jgi:hypothetical protein